MQTERLLAAMNARLLNGIMAGGLNPPVVAGGGVGFIGQPQFAQFVPRVPAFAVRAPMPNVYPVAAVNALPFMGVPQMAPMNPFQQPQMGVAGGVMQQQPPIQLDPLRRFRRQNIKPENTVKSSVDTQIPAPTEATTAPPCKEDNQLRNN
ncbi:secretory calcium-binding phosphoprotein 9 [Leuresthes tenuis]|uniref:secretory calcium-binding phosphoprotein 9 n=1 Tax=Leuresthes tenuis TaxID=355514 RepID=UPI003B505C94